MSDNSKIQWTDATWNPVIGCSHASPGCGHCWAERMATRCASNPVTPQYRGLVRDGHWTGETRLVERALEQPLHWRRPRRIFVCSMGDLFHGAVDDREIERVLSVMAEAPQHTYLLLTKRADRMRSHAPRVPMRNVWLGVTAEDQARADERIPILLDTPAAVRFVSVEPMLEAVDMSAFLGGPYVALPGDRVEPSRNAGIDWIISGCESGPGARDCDLDWMRSLRDQCVAAGVPYFLKQADMATEEEPRARLVKMPSLDGRVWDQVPEVSRG